MHTAQETAARLVAEVMGGASLAHSRTFAELADAGENAGMIRDLTLGTLRHLGRQRALLGLLAPRGVSEPLLAALLWVTLYQLQHTRATPYTVVDQAVTAARGLGHARSAGFVNAVLRRFLRERDALTTAAQVTPEGRWSHPGWWIERLRARVPGRADAILAAGLTHPPMTLRVNRRRGTPQAYADRARVAGIETRSVGPDALLLPVPLPVRRLPGYEEGLVSVQDAGAQWAARLLDAGDGMRVLDACAAPGGKSAHILETADVDLLALDLDDNRLTQVRRTLDRLGLRAACHAADARDLSAWWDGRPFDRILLDAPCSASGIVRRHPDARWLRRSEDLPGLAGTQADLLEALWQVLAPGGKLLYATCSVFAEENDDVVDAFLARRTDALRLPPGDLAASGGHLDPGDAHDGFFYALIGKKV